MRLKDRVIIVTGAASGIGLRYAQQLVLDGASVALADVSEPRGDAANWLSATPKAVFVTTDVSRAEDTQRLVAETLKRFGRVDGLVNNAALFTSLSKKPSEQITLDEWNRVMSVNVTGVWQMTSAVLPTFKTQRHGKIVNVASNVVHKGLPQLLHYVASKGAVMAMTRALARELGEFNINVNAIAPGYVLHEGTAPNDRGRNDVVIKLRALTRTLTPEDLVGAVSFLLSAESDFITGQTLLVDGGEMFA